MMRNISPILLIAIALFSCGGVEFSEDRILDQNKMADLLNEVALAEGFAESYLFKDTLQSKDTLVQKELDKVLQLHQISMDQFTKSYYYYKTHPEEFKVLVDTANARASRNREQIYTRKKVNPS
jgi:hypothetical protein